MVGKHCPCVRHFFNQQSTMCGKAACTAVNWQSQSHHTQTLQGHIGQAAVERYTFIAKEKVRTKWKSTSKINVKTREAGEDREGTQHK